MTQTFTHLRDNDLIRAVDTNPNATPLEKELAERLASRLTLSEHESPSDGHWKK